MADFDWKKLLGTVAPTLGAALGGPVGSVALKYLADQFLGNPDATEADLEQAMKDASPETLIRLKELDLQFKKDMKQLDLDYAKLGVQDRTDARALFRLNIWPQIVLSATFIIGYFSILFVLMNPQGGAAEWLQSMKDNQWLQGMLMTIFGVLTAAVPQILNFWFGSSLGSKEKTLVNAVQVGQR